MEYMESKMQDQMEAGFAHEAELQEQYDLFCQWYLSIPDADETLIDRKYLNARFDLLSPVDIVSSMWLGWRASQGI